MKIYKSRPYEEAGRGDYDRQPDNMSVIARFYPPSKNGSAMTKGDIIEGLRRERIRYGIQEDVISDFLENPKYCTDYIIAKGDEMVRGTEGHIDYFFETEKNLAPKLNPDGTVNYHELNMISLVKEGELLAKLTPPVDGKAGVNVFGEKIKPPAVKKIALKYGRNIEINEDQTEIRSTVEGHVALVKGQVFVSDIYIVPANVDNSIGDIDYNGSVEVKGNVNSGFTVKAGGDIVVNGIVEGATLRAGGKIVVKAGIHGMNKALLVAGSSVTVKFIESAEVYSDESINADSIMHSNVSAKYEVRVLGNKGFISGGTVRAGSKVITRTLGSEMGASTKVEVGISAKKKKQMRDLEVRKKDLEANKNKIEPTITGIGEKVARGLVLPEDKLAFLKNLAVAYQDVKRQIEEADEEYEGLLEEYNLAEHACVEVNGDAFPGCMIVVSDAQKSLTDKRSSSRFIKEGVDVKIEIL
ncbi:MAG: FapA family protein [Eubacterium sp.]|nr:FapA family protein [Eubacterium sp.]